MQFQIFPGKDTPPRYRLNQKYFFRVHIFKSRKKMVQAAHDMNPTNTKDVLDFAAITMPMVTYEYKRKKWRAKDHSLGDLLFYKHKVGAGIVAHEALHVSLCFLRACHHSKWQFTDKEHNSDSEEELAYVLTSVVRQITIKLLDLGF